jgi:hypothetical protein
VTRQPTRTPAPPDEQGRTTVPSRIGDGLSPWPHREPTMVAAVAATMLLLAIVALALI